MLVNQNTAAPTRKIAKAGWAGAVAVAVVAVVNYFEPGLGDTISPVVYAALGAVATWITGYMTKSDTSD